MRSLIFSLSLATFAAASLSATAQQTKLLTAEKHNEYGLVYSLPTTAVKIKVTAVRETRQAGPYFRYAKKYLGTEKVIKDDADVWTIAGIELSTYGVADDSDQYLMQLKPGALTFIGVDTDGMLLSINTQPAEPASAPAAVIPADPSEIPDLNEYLQYVDQDFISSQSSVKQAEMIANALMEVRDAYVSLTRGTADNMPVDGRQLELMLSSLQRQETALTRAFTGCSTTQSFTREFTFTPSAEGREVLFRMSDFSGFVAADDYSGEPIYITTKVLRRGQLPVDDNGEEKRLPKDAVIYAIPGEARISVSFGGDTLESVDTSFSQFGTIFGLAPSLFTDKKEPSYARFSPVTGALLEIGSLKN